MIFCQLFISALYQTQFGVAAYCNAIPSKQLFLYENVKLPINIWPKQNKIQFLADWSLFPKKVKGPEQ